MKIVSLRTRTDSNATHVRSTLIPSEIVVPHVVDGHTVRSKPERRVV